MSEERGGPVQAADPETTVRLIERARGGDAGALDALFARYAGPLRRWASGRLPRHARDAADTQDLVQETLLQALKKIDTFEPRGPGALFAYLRQTLLNRIRDDLRRFERRGAPEAVDSQIQDDGPSPLDQAIGQQAVDEYERALDRLSPSDREAIIVRVEMGCSYEELADILGKPTADAARQAAKRAVVRLVQEMTRARGVTAS